MKLTLSQAAKESGKVKSTIQKSIKDGRLSAQKNDKGQYEIDPAELFRAFPRNSEETTKSNKLERSKNIFSNGQKEAYEAQIAMLREMLEREQKNADEWRRQAQNLALTDQRDKPQRGFFGLFRKGR